MSADKQESELGTIAKGFGALVMLVVGGFGFLIVLGTLFPTSEKEQAAIRAANAQAKVDAEQACSQDLDCVAKKVREDAYIACRPAIERLAQYDVEWDGGLTPKFPMWNWGLGKDRSSIAFMGDAIRFQNGFGAWSRYRYLCDFDIAKREVIHLEVDEGRWGG